MDLPLSRVVLWCNTEVTGRWDIFESGFLVVHFPIESFSLDGVPPPGKRVALSGSETEYESDDESRDRDSDIETG